MRVRDVLVGLEDADPESDCRVWSDGMRVITTRYGQPVERDEYEPRLRRRRFEAPPFEEEEPVPQSKKIGRSRRIEVRPKWKLPEVVYVQSFSGARGLSKVMHHFDHQASTLIFVANADGLYKAHDTITMAKTWCGISGDPRSFNDTIGPEMRLCLTCTRMFDECHTACESCGVITHNDEMHTLGGDVWIGDNQTAVPPECERCYRERERIEAPYRTVMGT